MRPVMIMLAAMVAMLLLAGGVALAATLLQGTGEDDALNGTEGPDVIRGHGGNDFLGGYGGNDMMLGGRGNDGLDSTPSAEFIVAPGWDVYFGGGGDDTIGSRADGDGARLGVHVRDYVFCGGGDDTVFADETDYVASDCERVVHG